MLQNIPKNLMNAENTYHDWSRILVHYEKINFNCLTENGFLFLLGRISSFIFFLNFWISFFFNSVCLMKFMCDFFFHSRYILINAFLFQSSLPIMHFSGEKCPFDKKKFQPENKIFYIFFVTSFSCNVIFRRNRTTMKTVIFWGF